MPRPKTHPEQRYGRLTVKSKVEGKKRLHWICQCDCGSITQVRDDNLRNGLSRSCGCLKGSVPIHGYTGTSIYKTYISAKQRCTNPNAQYYASYGGRGIEFRFDSILDLIQTVGERPKGLSLDRIDNDGHYESGNVRWADAKTQRSNQRRTVQ